MSPVRTSPCFGLGVGPVFKLQDAPSLVTTLDNTALLNKLRASVLDGFAYALKLRSTQAGDGSNDLVGNQGRTSSCMCIHMSIVVVIVVVRLRPRNLIS